VRGVTPILRVSILAGLFLLSPFAGAQSDTGRILGAIADQSGAILPGATITITDVQRGEVRTLTSDAAGEYVAPGLKAGIYTVRVEVSGFKTIENPGIQLEVAQDRRVDFSLQPGEHTDTVVVTEQAPLLETVSSTLGGTLSNKEINDLPLNGRDYENLLQLRPGVVRYPGGGFSTTSTNGLRAEDNAYLVDGLFNSEPFSGQSIINGSGVVGDSATILPVDAIQEFNLIEDPPAEYGWKPGAIVNVGLKSGSNTLHGVIFGFGRDTVFDARNYFNMVDSGAKNQRRLEQYGGTIGGPIIKNKLFYFGAYEGQHYVITSVSQLSTPATVSLGGNPLASVPDAIAAVQAAGISVSQPSLKIAGCSLGPPIACDGSGFPANSGTNAAGPTTIEFGLPDTVSTGDVLGKIDYQVNDRHTLNGIYFLGDQNGVVSDASELQTKWLTQIHTRAQVAGISWTWSASSRWVNESRFGYNRLYQPTNVNDHNRTAASYGLNTGVTNPLYGGLPRINLSDYYVFPQELGGFNWPKVQGPDTRFQVIDHLSWSVGKSAVKFGGELHHDSFTGGGYGGVRGRIKFGFGTEAFPGANSVEDYFAGVPASGSILTGDPTRQISNLGFAAFLQDDWHAAKNLTLNVGLRYEINTVVKEAHNLLGNFDPLKGLEQVGQGISAPYYGDHDSVAPRFGFNWDPQGTGHTVVRGGFGVHFETVNWESFLALNNSLGIATIPTGALGVGPNGGAGTGKIAVGIVNYAGSALNWNAGYNGDPGTVFSTGTINCGANPCSILGTVRDLRTPRVWNWDLNVQHSFTREVILEVAYVANHGFNLIGIHDINQNVPAVDTLQNEQSGRPFNPIPVSKLYLPNGQYLQVEL
jgi:Carboxypeptidase regulatory-like domain/TonB dependent receptor